MSRNTSSTFLKDAIADSIIFLLQDKNLREISIREIAEKAGVNRSTYYRNFDTKDAAVRYYYASRLDRYLMNAPEDISLLDYLTGMFTTFIEFRPALLLLDRHGLTYLLLEELNSRIPQIHGDNDAAQRSLYANYHIGGVFNSFRYWLNEGLMSSPEELARKCVAFLPKDFSPRLH